ncbi:MAG: protein translocase subunit SecD [Candidatus Parabeggiatoa sp. nov. 3]|jgi:preprotein translocase subunit SecD|nr:MAG: protein translocase subunit SecD [Gammaproteobacteria bacterium]RKZ69404.1 MAG: protein translocase subunit SecD [Gammaproteobacteria bacterium]RKZ84324.1 MAG: protein translocase subunit SecD [Gammaproteobacteria bacterium]HEW97492.1 protein translocase subunit SecD [Beggiatoa sp.]
MNQYPLWKYLLIGIVIFICTLYALPNLFGNDPSVQISPAYARNMKIDQAVQDTVEAKLKEVNIDFIRIDRTPKQLLVRFKNLDTQGKAYSILRDALPKYVVAQNLASATPDWLRAIGGQPMYLGLDLRGGVHFLMQVDMETAIRQDEDAYINELRTLLREKKLRYKGINRVIDEKGGLQVTFAISETRDKAKKLVERRYTDLVITEEEGVDEFRLHLAFSEPALKERRQKALEKNITTLRNRVNELGVSEPIIQRQGDERIVVQLPGVQDTARAKEILGATATLEFRMLAAEDDQYGGRLYKRREGPPVTLKRSVIVTGDQIIDAAATIDQRTGRPAATIRLDSKGARSMLQTTRKNVGKPMAVVFIEYKIETKLVDGKEVTVRKKLEEVINVATIQEEFSSRFQITGLTSSEANNLALLLRAGALKAPMEIIEERTIGPSLGEENIFKGLISILIGFLSVMLFMWMRYKTFGMVANLALLMNVVILVALLSLLQATLTLPGMAGIVLTLGMAVDANVLIFEKIREEIANKNSPQNSIYTGYEKAFITIFDANLTTLIAAVMLFGFGTGPIKGFAITLSLGIITSMFTAIMLSRGVINFFYGSKKLEKLPV